MRRGFCKQKQNEVDAERDPGGEVEGVIRKTCSKVIARESDEAVNMSLAHATMLGNGRILITLFLH